MRGERYHSARVYAAGALPAASVKCPLCHASANARCVEVPTDRSRRESRQELDGLSYAEELGEE